MISYHLLICLSYQFTVVLHSWCFALFDNWKEVVTPSDPYVHYGENLSLRCDLTKENRTTNSSSMFFQFSNAVIPQKYIHIIDDKAIQLIYPVTLERFPCRANKKFNIICFESSRKTPLGNQLVRVDYAVKEISSFQCRVYNWKTMICSWNLSTPYCNYHHLNITLIYALDIDRKERHDCEMNSRTSCFWNKEIFQKDSTYYIKVLVENTKRNSSAITDENIIKTNDIVQPAKVENLIVTAINSTCLAASWEHSMKHRKRRYKIEIKSEYEEYSEIDSYEEYNCTLCNLQPYTLYTISVSNIPVEHGFWSDAVETVIRTPQDVPGGPPGLAPGSFADRLCDSFNCRLQLYWRPVDQKVRHGHIDQYKIQATSRSGKKFTFLASGNMTSFPVDLPQRKTEEYYVSITARTSKGFSSHDALLIIPSIEKAPSKVGDVVVEAVRNTGTNQYLIQWSDEEQQKVYNYTVYYCKRSDKTQDCRESLSWKILDASRREYILELHMEDDDFTWHQIGISREEEEEGKIKSSGIVWNKCVYIKNTKPSSAPKNVRFADLQPDRALLVEWDKLDCTENKAHVTNYLIHICRIIIRNGPCSEEEKQYNTSNKSTKYWIYNLTLASLYQVTVQAVSSAGIGPKSPPIINFVIDSSLTTSKIDGIVIGCLVAVVILIITVWICLRMGNKEKRKCEKITRVAVPEFPLNDFILSPYKNNNLPHSDLESVTKSDSDHNGGEDMQCLIVKVSQDKIVDELQTENQNELEDLLDNLSSIIESSDTSNVHFLQAVNNTSSVDSYTQFGVFGSTDRTSSDSQQPIPFPNNLNTIPVLGFVTGGYVPNNLFPIEQILKEDHKPLKEPVPLKQLCYKILKLLNSEENLFFEVTDQTTNTQKIDNQIMNTQKGYPQRNKGEKHEKRHQLLSSKKKEAVENQTSKFKNTESKEQDSVALSEQEGETIKKTTEIDFQLLSCLEDQGGNASHIDFCLKSSTNGLLPLTASLSLEVMPLIAQEIPSIISNTTSDVEQDSIEAATFTSTEMISNDDSPELCDTETVSRNSLEKPNVESLGRTQGPSDYVQVSMLMKDN